MAPLTHFLLFKQSLQAMCTVLLFRDGPSFPSLGLSGGHLGFIFLDSSGRGLLPKMGEKRVRSKKRLYQGGDGVDHFLFYSPFFGQNFKTSPTLLSYRMGSSVWFTLFLVTSPWGDGLVLRWSAGS